MAGHKGHLGIGIILAISFWVVLFLDILTDFPEDCRRTASKWITVG